MAAIVATIDAMKEEKVVENAAYIGNEVLRPGLEALAEKHAIIGEVRGRGLFQALELVSSREQKTPLTAADMAAIKGALPKPGCWPLWWRTAFTWCRRAPLLLSRWRKGWRFLMRSLLALPAWRSRGGPDTVARRRACTGLRGVSL
jgi:hypothetical protein